MIKEIKLEHGYIVRTEYFTERNRKFYAITIIKDGDERQYEEMEVK